MTADPAALSEAKIEYEHQTEGLFDFDPPPPVRRGAADYLAQLAVISYTDDLRPHPWTFWALAPHVTAWTAWAKTAAEDRGRGWLDHLEHVWLTHDHELHQALVDVHTGAILRRRHYRPTEPPSEGQQP